MDIYELTAESENRPTEVKMIDSIITQLIREEEEILNMRSNSTEIAISGRKGGSMSDLDQLNAENRLTAEIIAAKQED